MSIEVKQTVAITIEDETIYLSEKQAKELRSKLNQLYSNTIDLTDYNNMANHSYPGYSYNAGACDQIILTTSNNDYSINL